MTTHQREENNVTYTLTDIGQPREVMRITQDGVFVFPDIAVEEALQRMTDNAEELGLYKREWVGLTDDEVHALSPFYIEPSTYDLIRAAEAKLKEKNT
jgi:hypothetical protein